MATRLLRAFGPSGPEPVAVEFYRWTGKARLVVVSVMLAMNAGTVFSTETLEIDRHFWLRLLVPNTICLGTVLALGAWMGYGRLGLAGMRRATYACIVFEQASVLMTVWATGTVNSHMALGAVLIAASYRAALDYRTGVVVFGIFLGGLWLIAIGEMAGWWPPQPLSLGPPDSIYRSASRELNGLAFLTATTVFAFICVNWMVARLRHRERALQELRESLAARDGVEVGRHTGRTLKDTYVVGGLLGSGGMGEVYRAQHRRTRRPVAVKLLHPHLAEDPVLLARFRREAEIAGSVGSEHIVEVIDVDLDDGQPFLVLELLDGETLRDRVARLGPLPVALAADVFDQLGRGLDAAHGAGVVHRDLKPENLFLVPLRDGVRVKVLDFGVSKFASHATALTADSSILGTPDFMSPEQTRGETDAVDARADVFACGAVLYYALSGRRPFRAASIPAVLRAICDDEPTTLPRLRPDLGATGEAIGAVIAIAMAKPAAQRYATVGELAADLHRAIDGTLPEATRARAAAADRGRPVVHSIGDAAVAATDETLTATP